MNDNDMNDFRRRPGRGFQSEASETPSSQRPLYQHQDAPRPAVSIPVTQQPSHGDSYTSVSAGGGSTLPQNEYDSQSTVTDDELPSAGIDLDSLYSLDIDNTTPDTTSKSRRFGRKPHSNPVRLPRKRLGLIILAVVVVLIGVVAGAGFLWYRKSLTPVDVNNTSKSLVTIASGTAPGAIADTLKQKGLIRDTWAFEVYTRTKGVRDQLQAGTCRLSPSQSMPDIVDRLIQGCHETRTVTFLPGGTVVDSKYKPQSQDATSALKRAGYSDAAIKAALAKAYNSPLFADKPTGTSLEGYIYGDTYRIPFVEGPEAALQAAFGHMYQQIQSNGFVEKFKAQKLNLYQAITLASIVQREMGCSSGSDACYQIQRQIAQVFYKRLRENKPLGSDVTFIYGADLRGVQPTVNIDSPYNTRTKVGLPPGPIASPGLGALKAVADPAPGQYEFFVAGDDGNVYFAKTNAEHQANIKKHCQKLCAEF